MDEAQAKAEVTGEDLPAREAVPV